MLCNAAWHGRYRGLYYHDSVRRLPKSNYVQAIVRRKFLVPNTPSRRATSRYTTTTTRKPSNASSQSSTQAPGMSDQHLRELVASLPLGLVELTADGSVAFVNAAAAALLGDQAQTLPGRPIADVMALLRQLSRNSPTACARLDQFEVELQTLGSSLAALDIIAPIAPNQALRLGQINLADRKFLTLAPIDEPQIGKTHKPSADLSQLIAATALDMLPRLNAIEDATSALRTAPRLLDPTVHARSVEDIATGAEEIRAALTTLDEILLLRRGSESLQVAPLDLTDLLMSLLASWKSTAPNHSLELSLPGETPGMIADATRLERALNQIIAHVIQITPSGESIRVTIRPTGEEILVSVRNLGRVVDAELVKQIFKPLLANGDVDDGVAGGALGLILARAVSRAHGGRMWAELQEPEARMAVYLALPLTPLEVGPTDQPTPTVIPPTAGVTTRAARLALTRESPIVLLADRDARMARYLRANLEAQQYRVVVARDLDDVYRHIDLEEPDLLLLDSALPGLEALEALQRLGSYASAPVILLAPHADPLSCARALDLGVADYVAKPFSVEELLARLRAALRKRGDDGAPRETIFTSGELHVDFSLHQVQVGDKAVQLSKTEFKLLRALAQHAGMVLAHETLLERVWGPGYGREVDFVWVYIRRLRRKIEPNPSQPCYILTVPGVGYRLARI